MNNKTVFSNICDNGSNLASEPCDDRSERSGSIKLFYYSLDKRALKLS